MDRLRVGLVCSRVVVLVGLFAWAWGMGKMSTTSAVEERIARIQREYSAAHPGGIDDDIEWLCKLAREHRDALDWERHNSNDEATIANCEAALQAAESEATR